MRRANQETEPAAEPAVRVEHDGTVTIVTLNRPGQANAMDGEVTYALLAAIRAARTGGDTRALVLIGAGDAFSAGGDVSTIVAMREDRRLRAAVLGAHTELFREMLRLPFPSVAAVNGPAVGAAVTVALLCDLVVMAENAFLSDPRVALGLLDGAGGLLIWPLLTSLSAAREHLLLGDRVPSREAHRLGLANRVVAGPDVLTEATGLARRLAKLPPQAVREARRLLNHPLDQVTSMLDECSRAESELFDSPEHRVLVERLSRKVAAR